MMQYPNTSKRFMAHAPIIVCPRTMAAREDENNRSRYVAFVVTKYTKGPSMACMSMELLSATDNVHKHPLEIFVNGTTKIYHNGRG